MNPSPIASLRYLLSICLLLGSQYLPAADPPAQQADSNQQAIAFVTLRDKTGKLRPENYFGEARDQVRQGYCDTKWRSNPLLKTLKANLEFYVPGGKADITAIREMPHDLFQQNFKTNLQSKRPLLYLHGYNVGFEKACLRAGRFQKNLQLDNQLLLFSWPSNGALSSYVQDEANIAWSVYPLKKVLREMMALHTAQGFDVVAHSLGNRGVIEALDLLSRSLQLQPEVIKPINNLVLIAPDIDAETAAPRMPQLIKLAKRVTIYVSNNDRPLSASRALHGYPRLGEAGLHLMKLQNVEVIDVSSLRVEQLTGHLYHLSNRYVTEDLRQLLLENKGAAQRTGLNRPNGQAKHYWEFAK